MATSEAALLDGGGTPNEYGIRQFFFQDLIPSFIDYTTARNPAPPSSQANEQNAFRTAEQRGTASDDSAQFLFGTVGGKDIAVSAGGLAVAAAALYFIWKS